MSMLYGNNQKSVIELLNCRREDSQNRGKDTRKLALIVEGGGMRGVLSAGSLLAIDLLGYRNCFDEIYATSAGAVNAAYFLSGQGELGITVYFDSINNRKFYNPLRLTKIVDVDFVYDHIVPIVKPLDEPVIRNNPTRLYMSVSDVSSGKNVLVDSNACPEPISRILKASNALPILYNKTVTLNGIEYIDGGASNPIPVKQAIENGCTDILILLTKEANHVSHAPNPLQKIIYHLMLTRKYPELMKTYKKLHIYSNESRRISIEGSQNCNVNIATICPDEHEIIVSRTTMERTKLVEGAYMQAKKTFSLFSGDKKNLDQVFDRFRKHD